MNMMRYLRFVSNLAMILLGSAQSSPTPSPALRRNVTLSSDERIVGGKVSLFGAHQYFAVFLYSLESFCGGSLIHKDIVLTAAHCLLPTGLVGKDIYVGGKLPDRDDAEILTIAGARMHPRFVSNNAGIYNDFMLLKLDRPSSAPTIPFNEEESKPRNNSRVKVIGFGHTRSGGDSSPLLREVDVNVVNFGRCDRAYNGNLKSEDHLCAAALGKDACQNDSGGPLIDNGVVVGVVSYGQGCADPGYPGIYARTSGAVDFIKKGICDMSDEPPAYCFGDDGVWIGQTSDYSDSFPSNGGVPQFCPRGIKTKSILDLLKVVCCFGGEKVFGKLCPAL